MGTKVILKTATALGILSVSAMLGSVGANALWSDETSFDYSYSLSGLSIEHSTDNNDFDKVSPVFGTDTEIGNIWNNSKVNTQSLVEELTNNNEVYRPLALNVETYGAAYYTSVSLSASELTKNGPILDYATQYAAQVSDPAECNSSIAVEENVVEDGGSVSTEPTSIYSNETKTLYLCVGYTIPTEIGESGTHENTATVTAFDENNTQVADVDSWSGSVSAKTMSAEDWQDFVAEQVDILNNSNAHSSYSIVNSQPFKFNPDTFEPSSTYPDFTDGQPVYDGSDE